MVFYTSKNRIRKKYKYIFSYRIVFLFRVSNSALQFLKGSNVSVLYETPKFRVSKLLNLNVKNCTGAKCKKKELLFYNMC